MKASGHLHPKEFRPANLDGAGPTYKLLTWIPRGWKELSSFPQAPPLPFVQYSADLYIYLPIMWTCASWCEPWVLWGIRLSRTIHFLVNLRNGVMVFEFQSSFPSLIIPFHWDEWIFPLVGMKSHAVGHNYTQCESGWSLKDPPVDMATDKMCSKPIEVP